MDLLSIDVRALEYRNRRYTAVAPHTERFPGNLFKKPVDSVPSHMVLDASCVLYLLKQRNVYLRIAGSSAICHLDGVNPGQDDKRL